MNAMRNRGWWLNLARAAVVLLAAGLANAQSPADDSVVEAVWKPQRVNFVYHGYSTLYSCGGLIHGVFRVPSGCYLVRAAAACHNVVTDWAWVNVGCDATVCVDLVPPTVRHCVARALTGIEHGTADHEHKVHEHAPRQAQTAANALRRLAAKLPADPLPAPPAS